MIQRIQSVFLLLVILGMGVACSFPIWEKSSATLNEKASLSAMSLQHFKADIVQQDSQKTIYLLALAIIASGVAAFSISQYKKRVLQMTLGVINSVVIAAMLGLSFYLVFVKGIPLFDSQSQGSYEIGFYGLGIALLANMIANRFIRRDEMLVRSADRMR
jgi:hypothetical protein